MEQKKNSSMAVVKGPDNKFTTIDNHHVYVYFWSIFPLIIVIVAWKSSHLLNVHNFPFFSVPFVLPPPPSPSPPHIKKRKKPGAAHTQHFIHSFFNSPFIAMPIINIGKKYTQ